MPTVKDLRLAVDIGGTFTDTVLMRDGAIIATAKTATTPQQPALGALEGAGEVLTTAHTNWSDVTGFIHGTTLATNALIERRGAKVATITNDGFRDILEIAYERRYSQYAINIEKPDLIVPRDAAFTIKGRMDVKGRELVPLDEGAAQGLARTLVDGGFEAVAICLLHAYANPEHERRLRDLLLAEVPGLTISVSHEVSPEAREFDRLCTTIANAYIQPLMAQYLADFDRLFKEAGLTCPILMMTAGGGMTTLETAARLPIRLVESGPAGGAILAARIAETVGETEVLSFDMGGTTAKLCLIDNYRPQTARKFEIARAARFVKGSGMPVRIPVIEMIEIGAGGGSIASLDRMGRVKIGPESAGALPGPAAFGKGGSQPTVTDADVVQGLIDPDRFAEGRISIRTDLAANALQGALGKQMQCDAVEAGLGVSEIVDENMASAARMHAVESGKDLNTRVMIAFGGNGPLHATRVARRASVRRILIPRNPGVGSAVGFLFAPVSFEIVRSRYTTLTEIDLEALNAFFQTMSNEATEVVRKGAPTAELDEQRSAFMRYHGQGHEIEIQLPERDLLPSDIDQMKRDFEDEYARQFSRVIPDMTIEILNWSLSSRADTPKSAPQSRFNESAKTTPEYRTIICDVTGQPVQAAVYNRDTLAPAIDIAGPALIVEPQTTTLVSADFTARPDPQGNIWLTKREAF